MRGRVSCPYNPSVVDERIARTPPISGREAVDGIATDGGGNLFIAETTANRARKMTPAGIISTLAGNGMETSSGDGGLAAPAQIAYPFSVAAGCCSGNLFVAGTAAVRKITPDGI